MSVPEFENDELVSNPVERQAAQFIERRDCADWSDVDRAEFDAWIGASPTHRIAFLRLDAGWKRAERLAALRPSQKSWRGGRFLPVAGKIAAALGLVAMVGAGLGYYASLPQYSTYATRLGERETLTLSDGTRIELNTDTVVQIADRSDRRQIVLQKGEAYFDVVHNARHPFTVSAGRGKITDIGTRFVVRRDGERVHVVMLQGVAQFDGLAGDDKSKSIVLRRGDDLLASAQGLSLARKSVVETARETSWRQGLLIFDDTPLSEAAAEFNRYNHTKIIVQDIAAAKVGIGGTFATANVEGFARVAQRLLGLHVVNRGDEIVISR